MQLTNRIKKRNLASQSPAERRDKPAENSSATGNAEPPASFDDWLDGRLKSLYQAVLNEPLPPEIMTLLGGQPEKKPDADKKPDNESK
jgi:hypothetical protein